MLLNYLYQYFLEEQEFVRRAAIMPDIWLDYLQQGIVPKASYTVRGGLRSSSFFGPFLEEKEYRFHQPGHVLWLHQLDRLDICSEAGARGYFDHRYKAARDAFFTGPLGQACLEWQEGLMDRTSDSTRYETWQYFLEGVYGLCTKDGQPETIFLKQVGVQFIDVVLAEDAPIAGNGHKRDILCRMVNLLDKVASPFAPHERERSSRQRCIVNLRQWLAEGGSLKERMID
ncbi:DUF6058 family natural product biosynthesis protein [Aestuariispira insulae]|uniref:Uncharacterized protein n=1 Tax=Aestuariispira insulae TaxID=1461337 RepID=A0A3D9H499_9PROT|nr:DUF6058 family natural product biosynthesis protein [Aestuariispira insulae]RED43756.1 hypothetical protein DFP90_11910 [Aestuariispira insulae]